MLLSDAARQILGVESAPAVNQPKPKGSDARVADRRGAFSKACRHFLEPLESRVLFSSYLVSTLTDNGSGDTLRSAIEQANNNPGSSSSPDTITFASGLSGTITLTLGSLNLTAGNIIIQGPGASNLTVSGNNTSGVFVVGAGVTAAISGLTISGGNPGSGDGGGIYNSGALTITDTTLSGDSASNDGGGIYNAGQLTVDNGTFTDNTAGVVSSQDSLPSYSGSGGAIYNLGEASVTNSSILNNNAGTQGSGIDNESSGGLTLTNSTIENNGVLGLLDPAVGGGVFNAGTLQAAGAIFSNNSVEFGGGIENEGGATVTECSFSGNTVQVAGGGIDNNGTLVVSASTFSSNTADPSGQAAGEGGGGGVCNEFSGTLTLINSTIDGDTTLDDGGGVYNKFMGSVAVTNCTIVDNTANAGGGIYQGTDDNDPGVFPETIVLNNSIVAANVLLFVGGTPPPSDVVGTLNLSSSYNIIGDGSGGLVNGENGASGNILGAPSSLVAPMLGTLANNGGPTQTMALLSGSPAINAGSNALAVGPDGNPLTSDQRGFARIVNGTVDIGAYEFGAATVTAPVITWTDPSPIAYGTPLSDTQLDATANVPGTFVYTPANGTILNGGIQVLSVTFTPNDTTDYATITDNVLIDVGQTPLTGNIFVSTANEFSSHSFVGEYTTSGATVNASLVTGYVNPAPIAISGSDLFIVNFETATVGEYTTSGAIVNASLISGFDSGPGPMDEIAASGSDLFVACDNTGVIGEYTTSGATVNASLISGLSMFAIAVSGSDLFVGGFNGIGEYTTSGATVNASLISGLNDPGGIAVSGTDLFVTNYNTGTVGEYTTSGATVNASLISGLTDPGGIAVLGSNLFVTSYDNGGTIGEYTTSGATVNASLITGLGIPTAIGIESAAGPSSQLVLAPQPTITVAGKAITSAVTVDVEDANGDIVTTDDSTVTLSVGPGTTGALGGTLTATAVDGVATFSNVIFEEGGTYTLKATDGSLIPAVSNSIAAIVGYVDLANWGQISGWAFDPSTPSSPINVEVVISGGPGIPQVFAANETRSDLQSVLGSTDHGFDYSPPFLSVGNHAVSVWAIEDNGQGVLLGTATITSQNSMFDEGYYLREYTNVAAAVTAGEFATGYDHFIQYGQYETGYNPSPYWDYWANQWYLKENPDVAAWANAHGIKSAFMQYYQYGQYENRPGLLYFNASYYDAKYPWVASAVTSGAITSAFEHFVLYGQYEGYSPMKYFSSSVCDGDNAYIMAAITGEPFTSDYDWYIEYGQYEGAVVSNYYNEQIYLADNPDVAAAVRAGVFPDGFQHWLEYGQYEGRTAV